MQTASVCGCNAALPRGNQLTAGCARHTCLPPFPPTVMHTKPYDFICVRFAGRQLPFGLQRPSVRHIRPLVSTITDSSSLIAINPSMQISFSRSFRNICSPVANTTCKHSMHSYLFQAPTRHAAHHQLAVYAAQSNGVSNGSSPSPYVSNPYADELRETANSISSRGRGILASDESNITTGKRLASVGTSHGNALVDSHVNSEHHPLCWETQLCK